MNQLRPTNRRASSRAGFLVVLALAISLGMAESASAAATAGDSPGTTTVPTTPTASDSSVAPVPGVALPSHVRFELSANSLIAGQSITATVLVRPFEALRIVTLQRQEPGHWQNFARTITHRRGQAVLTLRWKATGTYKIRAEVVANSTNALAVSHSTVVDVLPVPPAYAGTALAEGESNDRVLALQQRLTGLGYWVGTPDGYFGDATIEAVYALQKSAGITPNGVVGPSTVAALANGVLPTPRSTSGTVIEVNLAKDLVMFVHNGKIKYVINTSTGGGYDYSESGATYQAITPSGVFHIYRAVNGTVTDVLGTLWRPRFFDEGFAIHGDSYVPATAVSHGCVRVSNEAIDWIWANNLAPLGTEVWVY